jgi:hypothetical protein
MYEDALRRAGNSEHLHDEVVHEGFNFKVPAVRQESQE